MQTPNHSPDATPPPAAIEINLDRWYSEQPAIRRLLAVDSRLSLTILVTLEPTPDGSDSFPTWLAMQGKWKADLQTLANRDTHLSLVALDVYENASAGSDGDVIADICWRDPCA